MIRVEHLHKSFGRRAVLRDVSLHVRRGMITGMAGPNACGKTTLLKCVLGHALPERGRIEVNGQDIADGCGYRHDVGYMPQIPQFPPHIRIDELLRVLEDLRGERAPRKPELVEYFGLAPTLGQPFGELSGGTRQKVAAVAAMMFDPALLILDEPAAGLDPRSSLRLKELLGREQARGKTVLLVSHSIAELELLAHDLVYMMEGRCAYAGSIEGLKRQVSEPVLERAISRLLCEAAA